MGAQNSSTDGYVGLFFVINGKIMLHKSPLADGESYGDFINYPESHDNIWQRVYYRKYHVDFDYYPRGRIVFNRMTGIYFLYYDPCASDVAEYLRGCYPEGKCVISLDEHYQCHWCNANYVK